MIKTSTTKKDILIKEKGRCLHTIDVHLGSTILAIIMPICWAT
jgi:hypothetical protein